MLSELAKIYDPLGLIGPAVIIGKVAFQEACRDKKDWDNPVDESVKDKWNKWKGGFKKQYEISFPRCIILVPKDNTTYSLHAFADSSKDAYCVTVFLVSKSEDTVISELVAAKTRLAPLKRNLTIPRLELTAARVCARLFISVKEALSTIKVESSHLWSDSTTVLHWLQSRGRYKQFVDHRVKEIGELTGDISWKYCPTKDNPADLGTRGKTLKELDGNELWWNGPPWIRSNTWPSQPQITSSDESQEEELKPVLHVQSETKVEDGLTEIINPTRYSSKQKLLKVTAWVYRFIESCKQKRKKGCKRLEIEEIRRAEERWIKEVQKKLKQGKEFKQIQQALNVCYSNGLLRCEGRFGYTDLPFETRKPCLLPKDSYFTRLVILECHEITMHGGINATLAEIRRKFWIPKGRQSVKKVLRQCFKCMKEKAQPLGSSVTDQLPKERVTPSRPFDSVGFDFSGAIQIADNRKAYIALFTCGVTRALHLELVEDMTASEFMAMLKRFIARRGAPKLITSDNAKTFIATAKSLRRIFKSKDLESFLTTNRIDWKLITAKAPWQGGFYERLIGMTKTTLFKAIGRSVLRFRELETMLIKVEGLLNNRPLTYQVEELDLEVITPNHLIYGYALPIIGDHDEESEDVVFTKRIKYLESKKNHVWTRWMKEYLLSLREYHRLNTTVVKAPRLGQLVLIVDNSVGKRHWQLGKVSRHLRSKDDAIRAVKIQISTQGKVYEIERPLQGICPLEIDAPIYKETNDLGEEMPKEVRTRRAAATAADNKRKLITDLLNQDL